MLTLWIGGNDLCAYCKNDKHTPDKYIGGIRDALDMLHKEVCMHQSLISENAWQYLTHPNHDLGPTKREGRRTLDGSEIKVGPLSNHVPANTT